MKPMGRLHIVHWTMLWKMTKYVRLQLGCGALQTRRWLNSKIIVGSLNRIVKRLSKTYIPAAIPYVTDDEAQAATKNATLKLLFKLSHFKVMDDSA